MNSHFINLLKYQLTTLSFLLEKHKLESISNPVLIYQMGKVASSSIYKSLKLYSDLDVFHVHRLNPENIKRVRNEYIRCGKIPLNEKKGLYLYEKLFSPGSESNKVKIISLVREPIGRNISAFFQTPYLYGNHQSYDTNMLISKFIENYHHNSCLEWFDVEMKNVVGIDVYQHSFPADKGFLVIENNFCSLLILKCEMEDSKKEICISDFLGLDSFRLIKVNVASSKRYASAYRDFVNSISLPEPYVQEMLNSKYSKHFYSDEERLSLSERWIPG
jgi:hypothetical protein